MCWLGSMILFQPSNPTRSGGWNLWEGSWLTRSISRSPMTCGSRSSLAAPPPGSQLRTELELREHYNASRNTVRDAIKSLITRGLVETRPGQGTFVTETIVPFVTTLTGDPETASGAAKGTTYSQEVEATLRVPRNADPQVGTQYADAEIAADLQISQSDQVISRHQQRSIDGTAWSLQTSFYPMRFVNPGGGSSAPRGQEHCRRHGRIPFPGGVLGIKQAGYREKLIVRTPDQDRDPHSSSCRTMAGCL